MIRKRPSTHQTGSGAVLAFHNVLPKAWVYRRMEEDYGIDGEVEIFDPDRASENPQDAISTGLLFKVQVKGTQTSLDHRALTVQFDIPVLAYYESLALPILLVRHHEPSDSIYVRWFHDIEIARSKLQQQTLTVRFDEANLWDDASADLLRSAVEGYRRFTSQELNLPVPVVVVLEREGLLGVSGDEAASGLRSAAGELSQVLDVTISFDTSQGSPPDAVSLRVNDSGVVVSLPATFSRDMSDAFVATPVSASTVGNDILMAAALAFGGIGHADVASRVVSLSASRSALILHPQIAAAAAGLLARAHRVREAVDVSDEILQRFDEDGAEFASNILLSPAVFLTGTTAEKNALRSSLENRIAAATAHSDPVSLATAHYNLGQHLRGAREPNEALDEYRAASTVDPDYATRGYFLRELAGLLFITRRYADAVEHYANAIATGESGMTVALYADALMYAGRYQDSHDVFDEYLQSTEDARAEWRLKHRLLPRVMEACDCHAQVRDLRGAEKEAILAPTASDDERRDAFRRAIPHDALCAPAWANYALVLGHEDEAVHARDAWILAGLVYEDNGHAWVNAVISSALVMDDVEEGVQTLEDVMLCAYRLGGEALVVGLAENARLYHGEEEAKELLLVLTPALESVRRQIEAENVSSTLRIFDRGRR